MVVLNQHDDVAIDFKYYENEADDIHLDEGSLLPLWDFTPDRFRKKHVTSLAWNPLYPGLSRASLSIVCLVCTDLPTDTQRLNQTHTQRVSDMHTPAHTV